PAPPWPRPSPRASRPPSPRSSSGWCGRRGASPPPSRRSRPSASSSAPSTPCTSPRHPTGLRVGRHAPGGTVRRHRPFPAHRMRGSLWLPFTGSRRASQLLHERIHPVPEAVDVITEAPDGAQDLFLLLRVAGGEEVALERLPRPDRGLQIL